VALPERLGTKPAAALDNVAVRRNIQLDGREISGRPMDMSRIDTVVGAGTTELWTVQNTHNQPHNLHVHGLAFQISPLVLLPSILGSAGKTPCCLPLARRYSWPSSSRRIRIR
jgi:Putative multicopper oxidases